MKISPVLIAAAFACAMSTSVIASPAPQSINVTASNWKFAPAEITVHLNQPVTLHLSSSEGVHGIASSDLGIASTMLAPGSKKDVTFTPTKAGTYTIHCSMFCGNGHANMTLVVKVVA